MTKAYDASDPDAVSQKAAKSKWSQKVKDDWLREAMSTRDGRRYFWELLERAHINSTSFHQSNAQTAFNEGERNFGLMILADITRAAPDLYLTMIKESKEENL